MFCPFCGKQIPANLTFCPLCGKGLGGGTKIPTSFTLNKKQLTIIGVVAVALVIFYFISSSLYLFNKKTQKSSKETITFKERMDNDDRLLEGLSLVKQEGENGQKETVTEYIYDGDGRVIKSRKVSEKTVKQAKDKITLKGTAKREKVIVDVKVAANEYYNNWMNGKWSAVIANSSNLSGYSENDLKDSSEKLWYKIKSFQINEPTIENSSYYSYSSPKVGAKVPVTVSTEYIMNPGSKADIVLNGSYNLDTRSWNFIFSGPIRVSEINRTADFTVSNKDKGGGGKLTIEKIVLWGDSYIFVMSGKYSNGNEIKNVEFGSVKDDLGNSSGYARTHGSWVNFRDTNTNKIINGERLSGSTSGGRPNSVSVKISSVSDKQYEGYIDFSESYPENLSFDGLKL